MARYQNIALRGSEVSELRLVKWKHAESATAGALQLFFNNVKYILSQRELTIVKMRKDIYSIYGYRIGINAVNNYIKGHYTKCDTCYMGFICVYLREDFTRMLTVDYSQEMRERKLGTKTSRAQ